MRVGVVPDCMTSVIPGLKQPPSLVAFNVGALHEQGCFNAVRVERIKYRPVSLRRSQFHAVCSPAKVVHGNCDLRRAGDAVTLSTKPQTNSSYGCQLCELSAIHHLPFGALVFVWFCGFIPLLSRDIHPTLLVARC